MDVLENKVTAQEELVQVPEFLVDVFSASEEIATYSCTALGQICGECRTEACNNSESCGSEFENCKPTCENCERCQELCMIIGQCGSCESCQCSGQNNQGCSSCESGQNPTASGSITSYSTTSDSITIRYISISKATSYEIVYRIDGQSTLYTAGTTSSLSFTITGLSPSTKYVVNYRGKNSYGYGAFMATGKTITTDRAFTPFNWTYAGLDPSTGGRVYGDTKEAGYGLLVTADEWNELVELVNDYYGSAVADFVRSGDTISAARVNPLARKLGVGTVNSGTTTITADFFNRLRDAYNRLG